jgi:ribosome-associated protein
VTLLDLTGLGAFTDYFLLCTGLSTPQVQAICDAIEEQLDRHGIHPEHREGRNGSEWLLLDYGGFIVHIFSERVRHYYDLERLWRIARRTEFTESLPDATAAGGQSA